ncbi:hypothetical protein OROHE_019580 [Orobanche hederae]
MQNGNEDKKQNDAFEQVASIDLSKVFLWALVSLKEAASYGVQPLSVIAIEKAVVAFDKNACVVEFKSTKSSIYQFVNFSSPKYKDTGKGSLKFQLINQRSDLSFGLFSGGVLLNPKLVAVSNIFAFANPKAPLYPLLAHGKEWNEMTVTWTNGYDIDGAQPFVEWGLKGGDQAHSLAVTLTFDRNSMCGAPARRVGWRDPGFIHTDFLKGLWPNLVYVSSKVDIISFLARENLLIPVYVLPPESKVKLYTYTRRG